MWSEPMLRLLWAIILIIACAGRAGAVMATVPPVPLPDHRRAVLEQMLAQSGFQRPDKMMEGALSWRAPGEGANGLIVRLVDPRSCVNDTCLTLIVRFEERGARTEAHFLAGPEFAYGDVVTDYGGVKAATHTFTGENIRVSIRETSIGWIVASEAVEPPPDRQRRR
jgi:hypothetical protein